MNKISRLYFTIIASALLFPSLSFGAGLWLYEGGTPDVGAANAGRAALASDASTAGGNPAGMTNLDRSQLLIPIQGLYINSQFEADSATFSGGNGGNAGDFMPVGGLHYVHSVSDDLKLGITAGSFFGLGVDYGKNWSGRYYVQEAELTTAGINPGVGYRLNDMVSVGAGFTVMYARLEQETAVRNIFDPMNDGQLKIDKEDVSTGFNVGLLLTPGKGTRLGLTYRSAIDLDFDDVGKLSNIGPILKAALERSGLAGSEVDIGMTVPQAVMFSFYQKLNEKMALLGNIGWQEWSEFGKTDIAVRSSDATTFTNDLKYDDTWHFAIGTQYELASRWLWSLGFAYDSSPCNSDNRSPSMPLDHALRSATGIQYEWSKDITLGFLYELINADNADFDMHGGIMQGDIKGHYTTNVIHCFAANIIWKL